MKDLTDEQLRAILITCDGRGKAVKEAALEELLNRRFPDTRNIKVLTDGIVFTDGEE